MVETEQVDPRLLGQRLAAARKARGVTQEQAAAQALKVLAEKK